MGSKKKKAAASKKRAPRKAAPKQVAPQAVESAPADPFANVTFPCVAHVAKSGDAIPVEVKDREHLDRLVREHGAVEVKV